MVLGLDLATKTGWCLVHDGNVIASGVQDFTKRRGESNGILFLRFRRWLTDLINTAPGRVEIVAYEQAHFRGGAATELCVGLQTHAQSIAAEHDGIESVGVPTNTLKKFAAGNGRASKETMIERARVLIGRPPIDDNEADAIFVAKWAENELYPF